MTVGWMRRLDFWIGVPVCFFLSIFQFLQKPFQKNPAPGKPLKKVLFLELSEIGSTILSYPAMQKLKELYPERELYFWIFNNNQDAVHVLGTVARENVL
ncbi:MAG TPA: hypothetical protein PLT76_10125, partial [Candidatus Omnitrophota bacterium]|nr:hypothetical protein [Candidatus Omnitrophota bacterium]